MAGCGDDDSGEICNDGIDNDGDGAIDCDDILCANFPDCQPVCGDGVAEGAEVCDGADVGTDTCLTEGFDAGTLGCNASCTDFDVSGCYDTVCGDNAAEGTEACDGADLRTTTCQDRGFTFGDLACANDCTFDESGCYDTVTCDDVTLSSSGALANGGDSQGGEYDWYYQELVGLGTADTYVLTVELYGDFVAGGIVTGAHTLGVGADDNYESCAYCVLLRRCTDSTCASIDTSFFANAGTLQLDTLSPATTGPIQGSLSGVTWAEVTIDSQTYHSTEVPGGECFDLAADHTVDATVDAQ
jgi:hypothetical protein